MKNYSDGEMLLAAQIAYLDVRKGQSNNRCSIEEILIKREEELSNIESYRELTEAEKSQRGTINNIRKIAEDQDIHLDNWRIRAVDNDEHGSGMYGCLIDTGDNNAIVSFRGSEAIDAEQVEKDWLKADIGLLNSTGTAQQERAQKFLEKINKDYVDEYEGFGITGHSLGGNLASHATLTAKEPIAGKISRCVNFDGPGVSNEYILVHADDIKRNGDKINHYQYSVVGSLLFPIPGSNYRTIEAGDADSVGERHSLTNVHTYGGQVRDGEKDTLAKCVDPIIKTIELLTSNPGYIPMYLINLMYSTLDNALNNVLSNILQSIKTGIENGISTFFGTSIKGDFEVSPEVLYNMSESLETAEKDLDRIIDRTEDIISDLRYLSISGLYYKNKLRSSSNSLKSDMNAIMRISSSLCDCAGCYDRTDTAVEQSYAGI